MSIVYLGLGTNLGNKKDNIHQAVKLISEQIGEIITLSALYRSKPWGFESENMFVNAAVKVSTTLTPLQLLQITQSIELEIGRTQKSITGIYKDRLIDIDILLYNRELIVDESNDLIIPHKQLLNRDFVLVPLSDIDKDLLHPVTKKELASYIKDKHALDKLK